MTSLIFEPRERLPYQAATESNVPALADDRDDVRLTLAGGRDTAGAGAGAMTRVRAGGVDTTGVGAGIGVGTGAACVREALCLDNK